MLLYSLAKKTSLSTSLQWFVYELQVKTEPITSYNYGRITEFLYNITNIIFTR